MLKTIYRRSAQCVFAALAACVLPLAAQAATINIILSNMDVLYMGSTGGGSLYDAMGGFGGGTLDEVMADDISTAVFELDGNPVGSALVNTAADGDDLHVDLRISNLGPTITKGIFNPAIGNNGNAFGLDFFTDTGLRLRMNTDEVKLYVDDFTFFFTGAGQVYDQNLPSGLEFNTSIPVQFAFTATFPSVPNTPTISQAVGSGALTISGIQIPEPATCGLLIAGLVVPGLALILRNRRRT